jgi:hypothetical protein
MTIRKLLIGTGAALLLAISPAAAQAQDDTPQTSSIVSAIPFTNCLSQTFVDGKPKCLLMSTNSECQVIISAGQADAIYESPLAATQALDTLAQRLIPNITPDNRARLSYILLQVINGGGGDPNFNPAAGGARYVKGGGYDWYSAMGNSGGVLFIARAQTPECRDKLNAERQAIIDEANKQEAASLAAAAATSKVLRDAPTVVLPNGSLEQRPSPTTKTPNANSVVGPVPRRLTD